MPSPWISDRQTQKNILKNTGAVLSSLVVCFALVELVLWAAFPVNTVSPQTEIREEFIQDLPGVKKNIVYERDRFGFRSLSMETKKKPPNTIRIICMGHSTTDQPTQQTEDTWSGVLEKELREEFRDRGIRIEVAARGFGGHIATDTLFFAKTELSRFQPDMVILLEGINTMCWRGGPAYSYSSLEEKMARRFEKANPWQRGPGRFFQLYRRMTLLGRQMEIRRAKKTGDVIEWHSKHLPRVRKRYRSLPYAANPVQNPGLLQEFTDAMHALLQFLARSDIDAIVLGQPVLWKDHMDAAEKNAIWFPIRTPKGVVRPSLSYLVQKMEQYRQVQRRFAEQFGLTYFALDKKIPKTTEYFFDDCHFTDRGNAAVAGELFLVVLDRVEGLLKKMKR